MDRPARSGDHGSNDLVCMFQPIRGDFPEMSNLDSFSPMTSSPIDPACGWYRRRIASALLEMGKGGAFTNSGKDPSPSSPSS